MVCVFTGCHLATAAAKAAHLAIDVVIGIFRCHAPARPEILNLCLARLIGAKEEQHLPYLRLLALLVREQPAQVLSHASCLRVRHRHDNASLLTEEVMTAIAVALMQLPGCRHWWILYPLLS